MTDTGACARAAEKCRVLGVKQKGEFNSLPVDDFNSGNSFPARGGAYAPFVVERWTKVQASTLHLYYVLSTGNPYVVLLMESRLQIQ